MTAQSSRTTRRAVRFDSLEQEVFLSLWRTYDRLRMLEDELFAKYDLTSQQYNAMRLLKAEHPSSIPTLTLANRLVSRAPDITRLLDKLEQRSLIERERLPDNRRVVQVKLTESGIALLDQLSEPLQECHSRQLGHLSSMQLKQLVELLRLARSPLEEPEGHWR
jgi:DNA-binding MarR family transcriptional regulator